MEIKNTTVVLRIRKLFYTFEMFYICLLLSYVIRYFWVQVKKEQKENSPFTFYSHTATILNYCVRHKQLGGELFSFVYQKWEEFFTYEYIFQI